MTVYPTGWKQLRNVTHVSQPERVEIWKRATRFERQRLCDDIVAIADPPLLLLRDLDAAPVISTLGAYGVPDRPRRPAPHTHRHGA